MKYGYARVSTIDQDTGLQIAALRSAKCDLIVEERRSAVKQRPELDSLLQTVKRGDTIVIYKLDRLARSLKHLLQIIEHLNKVGATLISLTEPIDVGTPAGRMFLQILGAVAEFERSLIRERCMAGQLEALKRGKSIGRPIRIPLQDQNEIVECIDAGIPHKHVAAAYGISDCRAWQLHAYATGKKVRPRGQIFQLLLNNKKPT